MSPAIFTRNGYPLGEVTSALQKEVRRGNEEQAMFWALEMCPRYEVYPWRRLVVIANEGIGLANPRILVLAHAQGARRPVPGPTLDKHTARGKSMGRDLEHWLEHGTILQPDAGLPDPYAERAHAIWRSGTALKDPWPAPPAGEADQRELFS